MKPLILTIAAVFAFTSVAYAEESPVAAMDSMPAAIEVPADGSSPFQTVQESAKKKKKKKAKAKSKSKKKAKTKAKKKKKKAHSDYY